MHWMSSKFNFNLLFFNLQIDDCRCWSVNSWGSRFSVVVALVACNTVTWRLAEWRLFVRHWIPSDFLDLFHFLGSNQVFLLLLLVSQNFSFFFSRLIFFASCTNRYHGDEDTWQKDSNPKQDVPSDVPLSVAAVTVVVTVPFATSRVVVERASV